MSLYQLFGSLETGFIFGIVALGAYLTFQILDFPDLTVEGSFPLGAAVLIASLGVTPWLATLAAGLAGFAAGFTTALLNVRFKILHILAGILVAISLYSINLRIMGGPNKTLMRDLAAAPLDGAQIAALRCAETLTHDPASVTAATIARLRAAGLDDGEILEVTQVSGYFAYANRTVLGLGRALEAGGH